MTLPPAKRFNRSVSPWTRCSVLPAVNLLPVRTDPSIRPSRRRLKRATERWLPLGENDMVARITVLRHGGHERPVIGRGAKHRRFRFSSIKTRTTQLGEGKGEEFLAFYNEVATDVVDYECHPYQFEYMQHGKLRRYRPDSVRMLRNGSVQLIECKRTPRDIADEEYRESLACVAEIARMVGMQFSVLYLDDIFGTEERYRNVWGLFARRSMDLSAKEERAGRALAARGEAIEWGALRERLTPRDLLRGDAVIEAMLARGMLAADLDAKFTPRTILHPTRPFTGASEIRI
ncbi:hypothetical protein [Novosphingobium terrae]|uniref:hypothetical protein n=1 Tax=Novosphingobium terrae TaxID=2726189 RepID=UPI0019816A57|nr:hypothetical protein [Novosphingobium terrae]